MVVNALVTGLIVFKILKVFLEVKPTSVEQKLGSFSSTGGPKLRNVMFIIIESGMALFTIQLVRVVLSCLVEVIVAPTHTKMAISVVNALDVVIPIHQALNVIIISVHFFFYFFCFLMSFTWLEHHTDNNFGAGPIGVVLR